MKVALEFLSECESRQQLAADAGEMETMVAELLELERLRSGRGVNLSHQDLAPILRDMAAASTRDAPERASLHLPRRLN